jgi:hypothetical protein
MSGWSNKIYLSHCKYYCNVGDRKQQQGNKICKNQSQLFMRKALLTNLLGYRHQLPWKRHKHFIHNARVSIFNKSSTTAINARVK